MPHAATNGSQKRIAILGGGLGALSTAFMLTSRSGWQQEYEITIYQLGWRLGGKGACRRGAQERIEEHGVHVFMGFYDNAFRCIRQCYQELTGLPDAWRDYFFPQHHITLLEFRNGRWLPWTLKFRTNDEVPGDQRAYDINRPWQHVRALIRRLSEFRSEAAQAYPEIARLAAERIRIPLRWRSFWGGRTDFSLLTALDFAVQLADMLPQDARRHRSTQHRALRWLLSRFSNGLTRALRDQIDQNDQLRRLWIQFRLGIVVIRGMIGDQVLSYGFDVLDRYDLRDWLRRWGAEREVYNSVIVEGIYNLALAYDPRDDRPNLGAGTALRGTLRMFLEYRGAFMWKMRHGMGDTIFAPLYDVLKKRGVIFKFFHQVEALELSSDKRSIAAIRIGRQVNLKPQSHGSLPAGDATKVEYDPLRASTKIDGLRVWPGQPRYEQLDAEDAQMLREFYQQYQNAVDPLESPWAHWNNRETKRLVAGQDFHVVVLGIAIGALPNVCSELVGANPRWQQMVQHVKTTPSQAFQLWLTKNTAELLADGDNDNHLQRLANMPQHDVMLSGFVRPLSTWCEMSHHLESENWPDSIRHVAYFYETLTDPASIPPVNPNPDFPLSQHVRVGETVNHFLDSQLGKIWPGARDPQQPSAVDRAVIAGKFHIANVNPSDRYVLSVHGSLRYRLPSDRSGFSNLLLAGDWTANGLNAGCAEAAIMSGMQASRAICGVPQRIAGESDIKGVRPPGLLRSVVRLMSLCS